MKRRIISIDEEKCNGCGLCANACHEGAIGMIDGKAKLLRDDYCDGLGDCLPVCPTGAITFVEREALEYDEKAVLAKKLANDNRIHSCPGSMAKAIRRDENISSVTTEKVNVNSMLKQWPVQIKLAPIKAPYFDNANLLIAADCTAYAYGNFHNEFMKNKITLIGCPKLDMVDYSEKLTEIIRQNNIMSVTIVRMEVPCCGGIVEAVKRALIDSGKFIPWQVVTISADGRIC
jgi:ferredoxin